VLLLNVLRAVIDIFWESTLVFFVAYKPANNGSMEQPWLVQVTLAVSISTTHSPLEKLILYLLFLIFKVKMYFDPKIG